MQRCARVFSSFPDIKKAFSLPLVLCYRFVDTCVSIRSGDETWPLLLGSLVLIRPSLLLRSVVCIFS